MTPTKDGIRDMVRDGLKRAYDKYAVEPVPPQFTELLKGLR